MLLCFFGLIGRGHDLRLLELTTPSLTFRLSVWCKPDCWSRKQKRIGRIEPIKKRGNVHFCLFVFIVVFVFFFINDIVITRLNAQVFNKFQVFPMRCLSSAFSWERRLFQLVILRINFAFISIEVADPGEGPRGPGPPLRIWRFGSVTVCAQLFPYFILGTFVFKTEIVNGEAGICDRSRSSPKTHFNISRKTMDCICA